MEWYPAVIRQPDAGDRFSPARHALAQATKLGLSPNARFLAIVLALLSRRMKDGSFKVWRGRESIAEIVGLSTKTVSKVRRELLDAGLFVCRWGAELITPGGQRYRAAKGVFVLELVRDPAKFASARDDARERIRRDKKAAREQRLRERRPEHLKLQQDFIRDNISKTEYEARLAELAGEPPSPK